MAKKISELPVLTTLESEDTIPVVDSSEGITKQVTASGFKQYFGAGSGVESESTRTLSVNSLMSTTEIQAQLDSINKYIPYGATVTFQFEDGLYEMTDSLRIEGFFGGGNLVIQGNTLESEVAYNNQSVILDITDTPNVDIFCLEGNSLANLKIKNIRHILFSGIKTSCIKINQCSGFLSIETCSFKGPTGISDTFGIRCYRSKGYIKNSMFNGFEHAISCWEASHFYTEDNSTDSNASFIGTASYASLVYTIGTRPTGSGANVATGQGGQVLS